MTRRSRPFRLGQDPRHGDRRARASEGNVRGADGPHAQDSDKLVELCNERGQGGSATDGRMFDRDAIAHDGVGLDRVKAGGAVRDRGNGEGVGSGRVGAGPVGVRLITLSGIARISGTGVHDNDALRFGLVENQFQKFRVLRADGHFKVGDEHALVAPLVFDGDAILVRAEVIHDELPASAEVARTIGHFGIDRGGVGHEALHGFAVPDIRPAIEGVVKVTVGHVFGASSAARAAGRDIFERQDDLIAVGQAGCGADRADIVEAEIERISADNVVADGAGKGVLPILGGSVPFGEAPVAGNGRSATDALLPAELVEFPGGVHVRDQFDIGRHVLERLMTEVTDAA